MPNPDSFHLFPPVVGPKRGNSTEPSKKLKCPGLNPPMWSSFEQKRDFLSIRCNTAHFLTHLRRRFKGKGLGSCPLLGLGVGVCLCTSLPASACVCQCASLAMRKQPKLRSDGAKSPCRLATAPHPHPLRPSLTHTCINICAADTHRSVQSLDIPKENLTKRSSTCSPAQLQIADDSNGVGGCVTATMHAFGRLQ